MHKPSIDEVGFDLGACKGGMLSENPRPTMPMEIFSLLNINFCKIFVK